MKFCKRIAALFLVCAVVFTCILPASAESSGSTGSNGGEGEQTGNTMAGGLPGSGGGSNYYAFVSTGVTMQIVYHPYSSIASGAGGTVSPSNTDEENAQILRVNSYNNIINLVQNYSDSYNSTTVYSGTTKATIFIGDSWTGRVYNLTDELSSGSGSLILSYYDGDRWCLNPSYYANVSEELAGLTKNTGSSLKSNVTVEEKWEASSQYHIHGTVDMDSIGMSSVEAMLRRIIFGEDSQSGIKAWGTADDIGDIAKTASGTRATTADNDASTYAQLLRYLGASNDAINNYLKAYNGELAVDDDTLVPSIIWTACAIDTTIEQLQIAYTQTPVAVYMDSSWSKSDKNDCMGADGAPVMRM